MKNLNLNVETKDHKTPLYYAAANSSYKILSEIISNPKIDANSIIDTEDIDGQKKNCIRKSLFTTLIFKNNYQMVDILIDKRSDLNIVGETEYSLNKIPEFFPQQDNFTRYRYNLCWPLTRILDNYSRGLIEYFIQKAPDENINQKKKKIISKNKEFFACLAARYSDEQMLLAFIDNYKVDINVVEPKTIF